MGKKIHGRKLVAPKTTKRRTKQELENTKSKMFVFSWAPFQLENSLGRYKGYRHNPMVDCQTLPHFVYRSKLQFLVSSRNQFQDGSQCDYPCRLSLKKLKVFMIREKNQRDEEKKDKVIFENSILQFNFLQLLSCFLFQKGVFQGSIKFSTHPGGSHLGV